MAEVTLSKTCAVREEITSLPDIGKNGGPESSHGECSGHRRNGRQIPRENRHWEAPRTSSAGRSKIVASKFP